MCSSTATSVIFSNCVGCSMREFVSF